MSQKKKEYFTLMIVPGPSSKTKVVRIAKSAIKAALYAMMGIVFLGLYISYEYSDLRNKLIELETARAEVLQSKRWSEGNIPKTMMRDFDTMLSRLIEENRYDFKTLLIFAASLLVVSLTIYAGIRIAKGIMSSQRALVKNSLIKAYCDALDKSKLNPESAKRG